MNKVYHLASCNTCQRIIKELDLDKFDFEQQNIKMEKMTAKQVDEMGRLAGSFEAIFSRRSMKFREWELGKKDLSEKDYRRHIIEEYTFLKRPVFLIDDEIFVGNTKKNIEAVMAKLATL